MSKFTQIKTIRNHYNYTLTQSQIILDSIGITTVYGIEISGNDEYSIVEDISPEQAEVMKLLELVASERLFPVHLHEFTEDYLSCPGDYID